MPKNDNGKFVCINHIEKELGENNNVVMPQMVLNGRSSEHSTDDNELLLQEMINFVNGKKTDSVKFSNHFKEKLENIKSNA
ncbi:hypothetical protein ASG31_16695 [Chryseobacterium sp. Leaf404]|uniref:hypothetical protein n=1 Tax=unclassified Chryseobacterium TaxID=2593645 RepID=UPI0006FE584B|nr:MULTISPECIES: hypothetical protein [unclassified Chryseobacterium]KQT20824.1 hypothetical protein ASG31_16695 [Chryseobacterium sp. Leaf404]